MDNHLKIVFEKLITIKNSNFQKEPEDNDSFQDKLTKNIESIMYLENSLKLESTLIKEVISQPKNEELNLFEGAWIDIVTNSNIFGKVINGQLFVPYCYDGDNELTGEYYDWRKIGDYWLAQFRWFQRNIRGFALFRFEFHDCIIGKWCQAKGELNDNLEFEDILRYIHSKGCPSKWFKKAHQGFSQWVHEYFSKIDGYSEY